MALPHVLPQLPPVPFVVFFEAHQRVRPKRCQDPGGLGRLRAGHPVHGAQRRHQLGARLQGQQLAFARQHDRYHRGGGFADLFELAGVFRAEHVEVAGHNGQRPVQTRPLGASC